jgi:hypothetical protein
MQQTAAIVGAQLNIEASHIHAQLLPADKLALVKQYRSGSRTSDTASDTAGGIANGTADSAAGSAATGTPGATAAGHTVVKVEASPGKAVKPAGQMKRSKCLPCSRADTIVAHIGEALSMLGCT